MNGTGLESEVAPVTPQENRESLEPSRSAKIKNVITILALMGASAGVAASALYSKMGPDQDKLRKDRDTAQNKSAANAKKANIALWAAQHGITQITGIDVTADSVVAFPPTVTLSVDRANPKACEVSFDFDGHELILQQSDAAGRVYDTVTITDGQKAQAALNDICPPAK